jgi:crotonobetainyl-CoA:carnitine CoA-transferase CaiB-like acyl-CoA transferase
MKEYPLDGIRIVDFTWAWAGPYATLLLALLGAEVIKVESQRRLDHTRLRSLMTGPTLGGPNQSTVFNDINLNKLSLTLNLTQPKAIDIVKRLVRLADVVAQNMRPGVMDRLGLSYEVLRQIKPDIIMLSSSALGETGPERTYVGYAPTFAAMSGLAYISGHPEGQPSTLTGAIDTRVGTTSAFAILAALNHRQHTGQGQHIDLSSSEAISCLVGDALMDYTMNHRVQERKGNRDDFMVPHGCYRCRGRDSWVTIAVSTEDEWRAFCKASGNPPWAEDERFFNADNRRRNQTELDKLVSDWTKKYTDYEVTEILQNAGVAAAPTLSGEMVSKDAHSRERGFFTEVEHPELGKRIVVGAPWRLSATPAIKPRPAPLMGEHNQYVLNELLGISQEEIDQLVEEQVVY